MGTTKNTRKQPEPVRKSEDKGTRKDDLSFREVQPEELQRRRVDVYPYMI